MQKEGISKLARVLSERMAKTQEAESELAIDYGDIANDNSLTTYTFPVAIPQSDYFILEGLELEPGDSVLVAWVGDDAIVLGKVVSATEEGEEKEDG